jgi:hypothetical protein
MEEELWVEQRANEAYEAWRARGVKSDGRKLNTPSTPYRPSERPAGQVNVTDPDSRIVQSRHGFIQGYTAQAVTTKDQIVINADVICGGNERQTLERLVEGAQREVEGAGVSDSVEVALADAGFWNTDQIARLTDRGIKTLVNPDSAGRKSPAPNRQRRPHYVEMREQLASEEGKQHYSQRMVMIEPVFYQAQPPSRSLPTKRPGGLPGGVEADHRQSQLIEALAPRTGTRPRIAGKGHGPDVRQLQRPRRVHRSPTPNPTPSTAAVARKSTREPFTKRPPREGGKLASRLTCPSQEQSRAHTTNHSRRPCCWITPQGVTAAWWPLRCKFGERRRWRRVAAQPLTARAKRVSAGPWAGSVRGGLAPDPRTARCFFCRLRQRRRSCCTACRAEVQTPIQKVLGVAKCGPQRRDQHGPAGASWGGVGRRLRLRARRSASS